LLVAVWAPTRLSLAADEARPESPLASAELNVTGTALLPDGSPAAGAAVRSFDYYPPSNRTTTADRLGKFELKGPLLSGLRLHVMSPDAHDQAVLFVPEEAVRSFLSQPLTIVLQPAKRHWIEVTAKGRPVEGARVSIAGKVSGYASLQTGVTDADGKAVVWFPNGEEKISIVAWHPQHGVAGIAGQQLAEISYSELSLSPPGPHLVRVLDNEDRPVAGRTIAASLSVRPYEWIYPKQIDATRATTDENGEVRWDWFPAEGVEYVNVDLLDRGWKIDKKDRDKTPDGLTTIHVRRKFPVEGRLILPAGIDAEGILITGHGFGPGSFGDIPQTRTRPDGSFTLDVAAGHGYVLGAYDLEWTSDIWSGAILPLEGEPQREVVLHGERATPLEFRVTRGSPKEPVADAWVHVSRRAEVRWTLENGETKNGRAGIGGWLQTDENGYARTGAGRGEFEIMLMSGDWQEKKTVQVESDEPVRVDFHREWLKQVVTARPLVDGKHYVPSSDALVLAWSDHPGIGDKTHKPILTKDGMVAVEFDESEMSLLLVDRQQRLSGFAKVKGGDVEADLPMLPNATYSGALVGGDDGAPLADREVHLFFGIRELDVVEPQRTDDQGRFAFDNVPAGVQLWLRIEDEPGQPEYDWCKKRFEPGENRVGELVKADALAASPVERPIGKRIAGAVENCRAMRMRTLVVLEGDDSERVKHLAGRLTGGEVNAIYRYLPVALNARQQNENADALTAMKWPKAEAGEVVMVVTDDGKKASATVRLASEDLESAFRRGSEFIEEHAPPVRDGRPSSSHGLDARVCSSPKPRLRVAPHGRPPRRPFP
jgi:hypothetical protein